MARIGTDRTSSRVAGETNGALQESAELLSLITNAVPAMIGYVDRDLRYRFVNQGYCDFFGLPRSEILDRPVQEFLGPHVYRRIRPHIEAVLAGETVRWEDAIPPEERVDAGDDGLTRYVDETYVPHIGADGAVQGFFVLVTDVSERKRAELALDAERARLRAMIDTIPVGFASMDRGGKIALENEEARRIWAGTLPPAAIREDAEYRAFRPETGEPLRPEDWPAEQALFHGRTTLGLELEIERLDGTRGTALFSAAPIRDTDGTTIGAVVATQDITERERAEAALRESEARLQAFADLVPGLLWSANASGTEVSLNQRWLEYTGQTHEETRNDGWRRAIHPDDIERSSAAFGAAFASGTPFTIEQRIRRHDGVYRWFLVRQVPFRDDGGTVTQWFGAATDIHDARVARDRLDAFIASISHDLQTPLTSVRAALGLLDTALGESLPAAERELLNTSRRNVERLRLQINDLLDANRLTGAVRRTDRAAVDLREVAAHAIEGMRPLLQEKEQLIGVDMPERLEVRGDRRMLEHVLDNLLSNAHRHTPRGTRIAVSGWLGQGEVWLAVHDTGPGIPTDELQAVFRRFYRAAGNEREGMGLGLAIAHDAVQAQGGRMWAESERGRGTTVFVVLPGELA